MDFRKEKERKGISFRKLADAIEEKEGVTRNAVNGKNTNIRVYRKLSKFFNKPLK